VSAQEPIGARLSRLFEIDVSEEIEPPPPVWKHEVGSELRGVFLNWITVPGRFEVPERLAIVEDDSGVRHSVGCGLTMMKSEMKRTAPRPGDSIEIKRLADKDTGKPRPLQTFRITVDRNNSPPTRADWNLEGGRDERA